MPVNFCEAGANCALAMLDHLGDRLHMVADVWEELERKASVDGSPALRRFLDEFPGQRVRTLDLQLAAEVAAAKKVTQIPGSHTNEDLGEIATVFYAARRRDEGEVFKLITDDREGKRLALDRDLEIFTTPTLIVEMVGAASFAYADGDRVWRQCFSNRQRWKGFRAAVERECPERLPDPLRRAANSGPA